MCQLPSDAGAFIAGEEGLKVQETVYEWKECAR
jgi:hypothetical protein